MEQETLETPAPTPVEAPRAAPRPTEPAPPRGWNVVLIDDDFHTYEYVIEMVCTIFRRTPQDAFTVAKAVDSAGRAVCLTTHKEYAEFKRDQILGFGADPLLSTSRGSMSAIIEPADFEESSKNNDDGRSAGNDPPGGNAP